MALDGLLIIKQAEKMQYLYRQMPFFYNQLVSWKCADSDTPFNVNISDPVIGFLTKAGFRIDRHDVRRTTVEHQSFLESYAQ